jgi:hypothetical protein
VITTVAVINLTFQSTLFALSVAVSSAAFLTLLLLEASGSTKDSNAKCSITAC